MYDPICQELAEHFLDDSASNKRIADLAQYVQDCVEAWLLNPTSRFEKKEQ